MTPEPPPTADSNDGRGPAPLQPSFAFDNSYARLPERFFERLSPTPVSAPALLRVNRELADLLGLDADALASPAGIRVLAGNETPAGAEPLSMAYAGHQFGGWVPQLGDGRAILLGEIVGRDGVRRDVQLKGAGRTPFSRQGDGRAGLGPVLREYIVSEAMYALGIATTRSLAAVTTGDTIVRETLLPGAVLTRVAQSHIRVGTFQFFAARRDVEALRLLADHVIDRHYPAAREAASPYIALLRAVTDRQASLIADWMGVGFIHGVMNTDNCSIAGETIDYGPCAFMDAYHPDTVYSSIDRNGRYAYANQPSIAYWNLAMFAQTLLPLIDENEEKAVELAREQLETFPETFQAAQLASMRTKLGLEGERDGDAELASELLGCMAAGGADFTLTFRGLADIVEPAAEDTCPVARLFHSPDAFTAWAARWRQRLRPQPGGSEVRRETEQVRTSLRAANPVCIPRNHLVEEVIVAAVERGDLAPFARLVEVLASPFEEQQGCERFMLPPRPDQVVRQTFCGT